MLVSCCLSSDWDLWRLVVRPVEHPIRGGWGLVNTPLGGSFWELRSGQLADLEQAADQTEITDQTEIRPRSDRDQTEIRPRSGQLADLEQAANHALLVHALHHLLHS